MSNFLRLAQDIHFQGGAMFVILPRILPRATAEILIVVFDRDPRCSRYTRSKKRRCTEATGVDYLLERTTLSFTFYAYILRPRCTTRRPRDRYPRGVCCERAFVRRDFLECGAGTLKTG